MNTPNVIDIRDLHKVYDTGAVRVHALKGVSLEVAPGEFVAIMGASGSGKSTLMNIIGCLDRPTSGQYLLDGMDVSQLSKDRRADIRNRKIGFVFQGFNLLRRTSALENVELPLIYSNVPAAERTRRSRLALAAVGLAHRIVPLAEEHDEADRLRCDQRDEEEGNELTGEASREELHRDASSSTSAANT